MSFWKAFKLWHTSHKIIVIIVLAFLGLLIQFTFPSKRVGPLGIGLPSAMETFVGENVVFSIDYPSSWVANELPQGSHGDKEIFALIINPGNWMPSVWFAFHDFQEGSINQVAEWGESRILRQRSMYQSISLTTISTSKFNGLIRQYSWESESPLGRDNIRCEDIYILENRIGYIISFCSKDKDWGVSEVFFRQMIESFDLH